MKIEVYIMARNEERIIPYLVRHYSRFADIIFLEGNSTDKTIDVALSYGCRVVHYDTPDELSDQTHVNIKNECWKDSMADWIIVVDADEFIYHPDLVKLLTETKATIIEPSFHNMFSEKFPTTPGQIYDEVNMGTIDGGIWRTKPVIFKRSEIQSMNWHPGSHYCSPVGNVIVDKESGVKLLHMRFLGREYVFDHYYKNSMRMSEDNKSKDWGLQYFWDKQKIDEIFETTELIKII